MPHHDRDDHRERPEHVVTDPQESSAENGDGVQSGGSSSEIDRDPGFAPADESRERPEQAVTDNISKTGGTGNPIADTAIQAVNTHNQNPPRDEDDDSKGDTQRKDDIADDSRERPESAVSDDRNSQDFSGR